MTSMVKVTASCDDKTEVQVHLSDRSESQNNISGLQDGQSETFHVYDSRIITVLEVPKGVIKFDDLCTRNRQIIRDVGSVTKALMDHPAFHAFSENGDRGEMKANIMLAYRHLEDARMRLGKAIQAHDGGTSVYEK